MQPIFVIGPTNAGKSTLLDASKRWDNIGTIEVGKMMRAKYPPSHFQGSSNPKHTAAEAWQMLLDGMQEQERQGKDFVLIDGQPRDVTQATEAIRCWPDAWYLLLSCSHEERSNRAYQRDGNDPEKMKLTEARLISDYQGLYHVLLALHVARVDTLQIVDTGSPSYNSVALAEDIAQRRYLPGPGHVRARG